MIYRWIVICIFIVQILGTGIGMYAAKAYVEQVAGDTVKEAVAPLVDTVRGNSQAVAEFRAFKDSAPRFTADSAKVLKAEAVAEAVALTRASNDQLAREMKTLSEQIVELKIMLARMGAHPARN